MRLLRNSWLSGMAIASVLLLSSCHSNPSGGTAQAANIEPSSAAAETKPAPDLGPPTLTVPEGTRIEVRLQDRVSSENNRGGDRFEATLAEPIVVDNYIVAPKGAEVTGRVVEARPGGHLRTPAELALTLSSINIGGETYDLRTSTVARRARSHKKRNAEFIGGMAAGGALLGALIGHGEGAAIGAGIGAGAGTGTAYATGKKDIVFPSETRLRFELRQALTVNRPS